MMLVNLIFLFSGVSLPHGTLKELADLYYQGHYEQVIQEARLMLSENLDKETSVKLHEYVGFSYVALGQNDRAKEEFRTLLILDSTLVLDPLKISPKIIQVFEEARGEVPKPLTILPRDSLALSITHDSSLTISPLSFRRALVFSTLFPGAGQAYSGYRLKGWGFMVGEGLSITGLVVSHIFMLKARDEYVEATEPDDIEAKYRIYNNWYCTRNTLGGLSLGIWFSAPLELVLFPPKWAKSR